MITLKLRRVSLPDAPWGATLDKFRPEYDGRVLVLELDSTTDLECDARCFNLDIDVTSFNAPCSEDLTRYGWYDAVVERVGYDPAIVHCYFNEGNGEWVDYLAPAKIITRAAYVIYREQREGRNGCWTAAIIAQAYIDDEELAKRVTGKWLDQMRGRKAELINPAKGLKLEPGAAAGICGKQTKDMDPDPTPPPAGIMTSEEEETLSKLQQDRQDAAREERELLLTARARKPADYRFPKKYPRFEEMTKDMSPREREGFSLFQKEDLIRWGEICDRGHTAIMAQHELFQTLHPRIQAIIDRNE